MATGLGAQGAGFPVPGSVYSVSARARGPHRFRTASSEIALTAFALVGGIAFGSDPAAAACSQQTDAGGQTYQLCSGSVTATPPSDNGIQFINATVTSAIDFTSNAATTAGYDDNDGSVFTAPVTIRSNVGLESSVSAGSTIDGSYSVSSPIALQFVSNGATNLTFGSTFDSAGDGLGAIVKNTGATGSTIVNFAGSATGTGGTGRGIEVQTQNGASTDPTLLSLQAGSIVSGAQAGALVYDKTGSATIVANGKVSSAGVALFVGGGSSGDAAINMTGSSEVSGGTQAAFVSGTGAGLSITASSSTAAALKGSLVALNSGAITTATTSAAAGISVSQNNAASSSAVLVEAGSVNTPDGVFVRNAGKGATTVNGSALSGSTGNALTVLAATGATSASITGNVAGAVDGARLTSSTGGISATFSGGLSGGDYGVAAVRAGASGTGGDVAITTGGKIGVAAGLAGIFVDQGAGTGTTTVTSNATIDSLSGTLIDGVRVRNAAGAAGVTVAGTIGGKGAVSGSAVLVDGLGSSTGLTSVALNNASLFSTADGAADAGIRVATAGTGGVTISGTGSGAIDVARATSNNLGWGVIGQISNGKNSQAVSIDVAQDVVTRNVIGGITGITLGTGSVSVRARGDVTVDNAAEPGSVGIEAAVLGTSGAGGATLTLDSGATVTSSGIGLRAQTLSASGITKVTASGTVLADGDAIVATTDSSGDLTVTASGAITSDTGVGIYAERTSFDADGDIDVTYSGSLLTAATNGIETQLGGSFDIATVTVSGTIQATDFGVYQIADFGSNTLNVTATGVVDPDYGVYQFTFDGTNSVTNAGLIEGDLIGVWQEVGGFGANSITNTGTIEGFAEQGILVAGGFTGTSSFGGAGGTVRGGTVGLQIESVGGDIVVGGSNDITGFTQEGVLLQQFGNSLGNIDFTATGGSVTGFTAGLSIESDGAGAITVDSGADITGQTLEGIRVVNSAVSEDIGSIRIDTQAGTTTSGTTFGIFSDAAFATGGTTMQIGGDVSAVTADAVFASSFTDAATSGGITIGQGAGSRIEGATGGIHAEILGRSGAVSIATLGTVAAADPAGASAPLGGAIAVQSRALNGDTVTVSAAAVEASGIDGINVERRNGNGAVTVTANGPIGSGSFGPGTLRSGIVTEVTGNSNAAQTVNLVGTIGGLADRAGENGVHMTQAGATNSGAMTLNITGAGSAYATGDALLLTQFGTGPLTVTGTGNGTIDSSTGAGLRASIENGSSGQLSIAMTQTITGTVGIDATSAGTGPVIVNANGDVTGTTDEGIRAVNTRATVGAGRIEVNTAAGTTVTGATDGIFIDAALTTGGVRMTVAGDVEGQSSDGIFVTSNTSAATNQGITITQDAGSTITGVTNGLHAEVLGRSGAINVTTNGTVAAFDTTGFNDPYGGAVSLRSDAIDGSKVTLTTNVIEASNLDGINILRQFGNGPVTVSATGSIGSGAAGPDSLRNGIVVEVSGDSNASQTLNLSGSVGTAVDRAQLNGVRMVQQGTLNGGAITVNATGTANVFATGNAVDLRQGGTSSLSFLGTGTGIIDSLNGTAIRAIVDNGNAGLLTVKATQDLIGVAGIDAEATGRGGIVINASNVTSTGDDAIRALNSNTNPDLGSIQIITAAGRTISATGGDGINSNIGVATSGTDIQVNGRIESTEDGVDAVSFATSGNIKVSQATTSVIAGTDSGVTAQILGTGGNIVLQMNGTTTASAGTAIRATSLATGGDTIDVRANLVQANGSGIDVLRSSGTGGIIVNQNGAMSGLSSGKLATGIAATTDNGAGGNIQVNLNSQIGSAGDRAGLGIVSTVTADGSTGNIATAFNNGSIFSTGDAVRAAQGGPGNVSITGIGNGTIDSLSGDGVNSRIVGNQPGTTLVRLTQTVNAGGDGIDAETEGTGAITVTVQNNVTAGGDGVSVANNALVSNAGAIDVTLASGKAILAGGDGIESRANAATGGTRITTSGTVTSTGADGIDARSNSVDGDVTILANAAVSGASNAITAGIDGSGGALSITANAALTATAGNGVLASSDSFDAADGITISTRAITATGGDGINAVRRNTAGAIAITSGGAILGNGGLVNGIVATGQGGGDITVTLGANVGSASDRAAQAGVVAQQQLDNAAGNVSIALGTASIFADAGPAVRATQAGDGTIAITETGGGTIDALTGRGLVAEVVNGGPADIALSLTHSISAGDDALTATTDGDGDIIVVQNGTVVSTGGVGILATNVNAAPSAARISVTTGKSVTASDDGIRTVAGLATGGTLIAVGGDVGSTGGDAVDASSASANGDIGVKTASGTKLTAASNGISARVTGAGGAIDILSGSAITAGASGIVATSSSADAGEAIAITSNGAIKAANTGILATRDNGAGALSIVSNGTIGGNATFVDGIVATSNGGGRTDVTVTADVGSASGRATNRGVVASNTATGSTGAVAVTLTGSSVYSTGGAAVSALQSGNAGVTVTGTGAGLLSSTGNVGVVATHGGTGAGDVSVTLAQAVSGTGGIAATSLGTGKVAVTTTGSVTGTKGDAILAGTTGAGTVDVTTSGLVSATGGDGIDAFSAAGNVTVLANEAVSATGGVGILAQVTGKAASAASIAVTTAAGKSVTASDDGIRTVAGLATGGTLIAVGGDVGSSGGDAVDASSASANGDIGVKTASGTKLTAAANGISARVTGAGGAIDILSGSAITAGASGIVATSSSADAGETIAITSNGAIKAANTGILATRDNGAGALAIVSNGTIGGNATLNQGIVATQNGGGSSSVAINADIGATTGTAVQVSQTKVGAAGGIAVTLNNASIIGGKGSGLALSQAGNGAVSFTGTGSGSIACTSGPAISSQVTGGGAASTSIDVAQNVSCTSGIVASTTGKGDIAIEARGNVTGTAGTGISATNSAAMANAGNISIRNHAGRSVAATGGHGIVTDLGISTGTVTVFVDGAVTAPGFNGVDMTSVDGINRLVVSATGSIDPVIGADQSTVNGANIVENAGLIEGDQIGVQQVATGTGTDSVVNDGTIRGLAAQGVRQAVANGNASFTGAAGGSVIGATFGVDMAGSGTGNLSLTGANAITGTGNAAVRMVQSGGTSAAITLATTGGTMTGAAGIVATTNGAGAVSLTPGGAVIATAGTGITASSTGGDVTVAPASTVSAAGIGISAATSGAGDVAVTTVDLLSAVGTGIVTTAGGGTTAVTTAELSIDGPGAIGIDAFATTGNVSVDAGSINSRDPGELLSAVRTVAGGDTDISLSAGTTSAASRATGAVVDASGTLAGRTLSIDSSAASLFGAVGIRASSDGGYAIVASNIDATDAAFDIMGAGSGTTVSNGTLVTGGPAVRYGSGTGGSFTNNGAIMAAGGLDAVIATGASASDVAFVNNGSMTGTILLNPAAANSLVNGVNGSFVVGPTVRLGSCAGCTFSNAGRIDVGGVGNIQTTTLTGNFAQSSGASYAVDYRPLADSADMIAASGTASVGGTILFNILGEQPLFSLVQSTTIVSAAGGLTRLPGLTLATPSNSVARTYQLVQPTPTELAVSVIVDYSPAGLTGNRAAVGVGIDAASTNPAFEPVLEALVAITDLDVYNDALDDLSGEGLTAMQTAALTRAERFHGIINRQLHAEALDGAASGAARSGDLSLWISGDFGRTEIDGDDAIGSGDVSLDNYGFVAGLEYRIADAGVIGIAGSIGSGSFDVDDRGTSGTVDSLQFGLFGRFGESRGFYAQASAGYSSFDATSERSVRIGGVPSYAATLDGETKTSGFTGQIEIGYAADLGGILLTPFANFHHADMSYDAFREDGDALVGLLVAEQDVKSQQLTAGLQLSSDPDGDGPISFWVRGAYRNEFETERRLDAEFAGAPGVPFRIIGAEPDEGGAVVAGGVVAKVGNNIRLFGSADGTFGGSTSVAGQVGVQLDF